MRLAAGLALAAVVVRGQSPRDAFDCPMRALALEYVAQLQPFRPPAAFQALAQVLQSAPEIAPNCTVSADAAIAAAAAARGGAAPSRFRYAPLPTDGVTFYADAVNGDDANAGTITAPFQTIARALAATRAARAAAPSRATIVLRQGTFYQPVAGAAGALVLTPADSGLSIQAFPGEEVWVSGATPVTTAQWAPWKVVPGNSTPVWRSAANQNAVYGQVPSPAVVYNGTYDAWDACQAACQANYTGGGPCTVWTWHDATVPAPYTLACYFRTDGVYAPVAEADHYSGYRTMEPTPNVWVANVSALPGFSSAIGAPGMRSDGARLIRARYPDSDPEVDGFGASFNALSWTPQSAPRAPDVQIDLPTPVRNSTPSLFQTFTAGVGGTCARFQPPAGYWCSNAVEGGGSQIYFVPTAMQVDATTLPNMPYARPQGAVVQTWRPGHWASWMFEVGDAVVLNATTGLTNFTFASGGFQGSRGDDTGEATYIENVLEELTTVNEWYYDPGTGSLYLWYNASGGTPPPNDGTIVITQLRHLFNVTGNGSSDPITDISFVGLGFRDTAYTYMVSSR